MKSLRLLKKIQKFEWFCNPGSKFRLQCGMKTTIRQVGFGLLVFQMTQILCADPMRAPALGTAPQGAVPELGASGVTTSPKGKPDAKGHFYVYTDKGSILNHYIPSGWMGDYGDIRIDDSSKNLPKSGKSCIKVTYTAKGSQGAGWAGIFWQQPANNWGSKPGGYDLSQYKKITFWARGAAGGEKIAEFKVGGITGEMPDSDSASVGPTVLTKEWKQYTIDLNGKNLSHNIGGFAWSASRDDNPQGFTLFLDDIRFES